MLRQAIDLPGVGNARELGGYPIGGRRVRKGVLIRTAGLGRATSVALERLHDEYRLQTLVDFRMGVEQRSVPDPQVPGATNLSLSVVEMEDFPIPDGIDRNKLNLLNDPAANRMELFDISYDLGMIGPRTYETFLFADRGKAAYAHFFRALVELEDGRAILWHCTDGKDRTGCAAMLLLSALGASRQTILADYMLTNDYNAAVVEAVMQRAASDRMPPEKRDALLFVSGAVVEGYMAHAIDVLEERYGSIDGYLREELGMGAGELGRLRSMFLV